MSLSDSEIRDVCAAVAFLYGDRIDDEELIERLSDLPLDNADRLRRVLALRGAQGGSW